MHNFTSGNSGSLNKGPKWKKEIYRLYLVGNIQGFGEKVEFLFHLRPSKVCCQIVRQLKIDYKIIYYRSCKMHADRLLSITVTVVGSFGVGHEECNDFQFFK